MCTLLFPVALGKGEAFYQGMSVLTGADIRALVPPSQCTEPPSEAAF